MNSNFARDNSNIYSSLQVQLQCKKESPKGKKKKKVAVVIRKYVRWNNHRAWHRVQQLAVTLNSPFRFKRLLQICSHSEEDSAVTQMHAKPRHMQVSFAGAEGPWRSLCRMWGGKSESAQTRSKSESVHSPLSSLDMSLLPCSILKEQDQLLAWRQLDSRDASRDWQLEESWRNAARLCTSTAQLNPQWVLPVPWNPWGGDSQPVLVISYPDSKAEKSHLCSY